MQMHIVIVLLYSVCCSVSVLSCVDVIRSFTYVLRAVILDVTKRCGERTREKARGNTSSLSQIPPEKKRIKQEFLAVVRLLLPTFNLLFPSTVQYIVTAPTPSRLGQMSWNVVFRGSSSSSFFFFVLGSHLPVSGKLLGDFAALLRGLQSPIKWYNKKKGKEREKERIYFYFYCSLV